MHGECRKSLHVPRDVVSKGMVTTTDTTTAAPFSLKGTKIPAEATKQALANYHFFLENGDYTEAKLLANMIDWEAAAKFVQP